MRLHGFILAIESYLVRKGIMAALGGINGARVVKEISTASELIRYIKTNRADFLIITETMCNAATDMLLSETGLSEKTFILKPDPSSDSEDGIYISIYLSETREEIPDGVHPELFNEFTVRNIFC